MAQYLIDSHIFLWASETPSSLFASEVEALRDPANDIAVSTATFWELSIKASLGRLTVTQGGKIIPPDHFLKCARKLGLTILSVEAAEAEYVRRLPHVHGDPFDRLLVAQAMLYQRTLMTRDTILSNYPGLWVFTL